MFPRALAATQVVALLLVAPADTATVRAGFPAFDSGTAHADVDAVVTVTGRVLDAASGGPLQGAQMVLAGSGLGAWSGADGRYSLSLGDDWAGRTATVEVRMIGYETARRTVTLGAGATTVDFSLSSMALSLDAIVETGIATEAQHRPLGNSVQRVSAPPPAPGSYQARPADREAYAFIEENDFRAVADEPLSTFSIDVDRASYSNVRRFINQGARPPVDAVRIEELINYFPYGDPAPNGDDPFSVTAEVAPAPWQPLHHLVRIGLNGRASDS